MIAQIILDNTKLTPGHITSLFVVFGAFLDSFSFYDKIIKVVWRRSLGSNYQFWPFSNSWSSRKSKMNMEY